MMAYITSQGKVSPGLGLSAGHTFPEPLGMRSQVVDELSADFIRRLQRLQVLK